MKKNILHWEITSTISILIIGFLSHFAYSWLGEWKPSALLFAVNESVWEHCKIAFWPALIFSIIEYFFIRNKTNNFIVSKALQLLLIPISIIIMFYTYTGILGFNLLLVDIGIFILSVFIAQYFSYKLLVSGMVPSFYNAISVLIITLLIIAFSIFTFYPPKIPLFMDPESFSYGIH